MIVIGSNLWYRMDYHMELAPDNARLRELQDLTGLEAFLDAPEQTSRILHQAAQLLTDRLTEYMSTGETDIVPGASEQLTGDMFSRLYDPTLPTIAIDTTQAFAGNELIGLAAQRRRGSNDIPTCNVIYIHSGAACGEIAETETGPGELHIQRGILIAANGTTYAGEFPETVTVNALETTNQRLLDQCAAHGIQTLSDSQVASGYHHKNNVGAFAEAAGVSAPARYELSGLWQDDPAAEYVIKPLEGSGGKGVRMFTDAGQQAEARSYYEFLQNHGYEPVIENRVQSYPLHSDGKRMDWNVRAIIGNGQLHSMYVRMDEWGGPVNRATGSQAVKLEDLGRYAADPDTAAKLISCLNESAERIARRVPVKLAGLDLTIDENGLPYLYEINIGPFGGVQTIAKLYTEPAQKLAAVEHMIDGWMEMLPLRTKPLSLLRKIIYMSGIAAPRTSAQVRGLQALPRDANSLRSGLEHVEQEQRYGELSEAELGSLGAIRSDWALWRYQQCMKRDADMILSPASSVEPYDRLFAEHPLEASLLAPFLVEDGPHPNVLLGHLANAERYLPGNRNIIITKLLVYGRMGLPRLVRQHQKELPHTAHDSENMSSVGAAALAYNTYRSCDIPLTYDNLDPHSILQHYESYLAGDTAGAFSSLDQHLSLTQDEDALATLNIVGLRLAMGELDEERLQRYINNLRDEDYLVPELLNGSGTYDEDDTTMYISALLYSGFPLLAVDEWRRSSISPDRRTSLAERIGHSYAVSVGEEQGAAEFSRFLLDYSTGGNQSLPTTPTLRLIACALTQNMDPRTIQAELEANTALSYHDKQLLSELVYAPPKDGTPRTA
jgi:glutathione synthase/RimK-type ligase-like ATP-grasp enzyme